MEDNEVKEEIGKRRDEEEEDKKGVGAGEG